MIDLGTFVAGWWLPDNVVVALDGSGHIDTSFGDASTPGRTNTHVEGYGSMAIDSAGRIIVAGGARAMWLLPNGIPDSSIVYCTSDCFVNGEPPAPRPDGVSWTGGSVDELILSDADAPVFAVHDSHATGSLALTKRLKTGQPDPTFGITLPGETDVPGLGSAGVVRRSDGSFLLFAHAARTVYAFDRNGRPDPTFGTDGVRMLPFGDEYTVVESVDPAGSDRWLVAARQWFPAGPTQLYMIDRNGSLDATFGDRGFFDTASIGVTESAPVTVGPDGRIMVAVRQAGGAWAITRLTSDGHQDRSFGRHTTQGWYLLPGPAQPTYQASLRTIDQLLVTDTALYVAGSWSGVAIDQLFPDVARFDLTATVPLPIEPRPFGPLTGIDDPATVGTPAERVGALIDVPNTVG